MISKGCDTNLFMQKLKQIRKQNDTIFHSNWLTQGVLQGHTNACKMIIFQQILKTFKIPLKIEADLSVHIVHLLIVLQ